MVAATGVEGLKAIVPVAAISNWYNYYRANGLVVGPGGYIGEDADELGYFIVRKNACQKEMKLLAKSMGRENGDFTTFWKKRNYLPYVKNFKAATFIIHGQSDWNVKQKHATQLWEALEGVVPRRMFLHSGGHSSTHRHQVPEKVQAWFDYFLEDKGSIELDDIVEVELPNKKLMVQRQWPHEKTVPNKIFFTKNGKLSKNIPELSSEVIIDNGRTKKLNKLVMNPNQFTDDRLIFLSSTLQDPRLLSGTPKVTLDLSVLNRRAANITVAVVEYFQNGSSKIITRGWADPQNFETMVSGQLLTPGQDYQFSFDLEPKQYLLSKGSRIGVVLAATDYNYTIRPKSGTKIKFNFGENSFINLNLSRL